MSTETFTKAQLHFLSRARVARLATSDHAGHPHVIPIVFATDGINLFTPLDKKPKRVAPRELKRVRNLLANAEVAIVVDEYHEDWTRLAWVLVTGVGEILERGGAHTTGVRLLEEKYPQYKTMPLEDRLLIVVKPRRVTSWGALPE